jgi:hypothetical protein
VKKLLNDSEYFLVPLLCKKKAAKKLSNLGIMRDIEMVVI